jgi:hypothetical protein
MFAPRFNLLVVDGDVGRLIQLSVESTQKYRLHQNQLPSFPKLAIVRAARTALGRPDSPTMYPGEFGETLRAQIPDCVCDDGPVAALDRQAEVSAWRPNEEDTGDNFGR